MPIHRVYFATEASVVIEVEMPEGATWGEIADVAALKLPGGLCHHCTDHYELADTVALLVDDEPDPDIVDHVEQFRAELIEHFRTAEAQSLGLSPGAGPDLISAWCDVIRDFPWKD